MGHSVADDGSSLGDRLRERREIRLWSVELGGHDGAMTFMMTGLDAGHARLRVLALRPPRG